MRSKIHANRLVTAISLDETNRLNRGDKVEGSESALGPLARITFWPFHNLDVYTAEGRELAGRFATHCVAQLGTGMDLHIYVPKEVSVNPTIAAQEVPLDQIEIAASAQAYAADLLARVPTDGLEVRFDDGNASPAFWEL